MAWCGQQQQQSSMGTCPCGNLPTCQLAKLPKCLSAHQLGPPMGHAHGVLHPYIDSQGQRQPVPTALDCRSNDHCTVKDRRVTASLLSGQMVRNSPGLAEITDFRGLGTHSPHMYRKFCKSLCENDGSFLTISAFAVAAARHIPVGLRCKVHASN